MAKTKYSKENLELAVASSLSMREAMSKCGALNLAGGTHFYISKLVKKYGISTGHFLGQRRNLGTKSWHKKEAASVLIHHADGTRQRAVVLVRALLEVGRMYRCYVCGLREWQKKKIILEIEHKDADFQNDKEDNLEFICPNCHSQTVTFCRGKKIKQEKLETGRKRKVKHPSAEGYWRTRDKPHLRKVQRPELGELQSLIQTMSMVKIGEKFGVSDNAVRKWMTRYGMEVPKRKHGRVV